MAEAEQGVEAASESLQGLTQRLERLRRDSRSRSRPRAPPAAAAGRARSQAPPLAPPSRRPPAAFPARTATRVEFFWAKWFKSARDPPAQVGKSSCEKRAEWCAQRTLIGGLKLTPEVKHGQQDHRIPKSETHVL